MKKQSHTMGVTASFPVSQMEDNLISSFSQNPFSSTFVWTFQLLTQWKIKVQ